MTANCHWMEWNLEPSVWINLFVNFEILRNFWDSFRVYVNFGTFLKFYFFLNQIQFWSGAFRQENYYNKLFYTTKLQWRKFHPMEMKVTGEGFLGKFWKKIHGVWVFDFRIWLISIKTNRFSNPMNLLNGYYDGFPMDKSVLNT